MLPARAQSSFSRICDFIQKKTKRQVFQLAKLYDLMNDAFRHRAPRSCINSQDDPFREAGRSQLLMDQN